MDFKQLEIFTALSENLSFSITADALNVSQPTVSLVIKHLETELDTPLFIRSTRELKITEAGTHLYNEAKKLLKQREKLVERFAYPQRKILTIGVSTIPAGCILPSIIKEFKKRNPDILVRVEKKNSMETIRKVSSNIVDIGIVGMKTSDEHCEFKSIYKDEFVFITANNAYYQKLKKNTPDLKTLAGEPFIVRENGSAVKQTMETILQSKNINPNTLNIAASINDTETIKQLAAQGLGTSFISKIAVEDMVKSKKLLSFELGNIPQKYRYIYLVRNKKVTPSSYMQDFLKCAAAYKQE